MLVLEVTQKRLTIAIFIAVLLAMYFYSTVKSYPINRVDLLLAKIVPI